MNHSYKTALTWLTGELNRLDRPSVASLISLREFYGHYGDSGVLSKNELAAVVTLFEKASDFREAFARLEAVLVQK